MEGDPWADAPHGSQTEPAVAAAPGATSARKVWSYDGTEWSQGEDPQASRQPGPGVPEAWALHTDPATGKRFWHNQGTGESRWEEEF